MRVLELFSGIGGWRYALGSRGEVVAAYDISPAACATYGLNHGHAPLSQELAHVSAEALAAHRAEAWVMSPPCQPFCRMGNRQGLQDLRSRAFLNLMEIFDAAPPESFVLENVAGFLGSDGHELLLSRLRRHGFQFREFSLCPMSFGIPNQRPRFYLVASKRALASMDVPLRTCGSIQEYLDAEVEDACVLESATLSKHAYGMDFVVPQDRRSTCFIGGYGQRYVGSGSFLVTPRGIRRFSPSEIARFMGLPASFRFPDSVSRAQRYKLLGNGLSIPVARWVLQGL